MIITTTDTYWQLSIRWTWTDLGYANQHTSLHRTKNGAVDRAYRTIRETAGVPTERITTISWREQDGNSHAELEAAGIDYSYSINAVEVEN